MDYVRLWVDEPAVGCGYRAFVVETLGHKWVTLVEPSTGARIKLPKEVMRGAVPVHKPRWRKIAKQLRLNGRRDLGHRAMAQSMEQPR